MANAHDIIKLKFLESVRYSFLLSNVWKKLKNNLQENCWSECNIIRQVIRFLNSRFVENDTKIAQNRP